MINQTGAKCLISALFLLYMSNGVSFSRVRARLMCSLFVCNIYAVLSSRHT